MLLYSFVPQIPTTAYTAHFFPTSTDFQSAMSFSSYIAYAFLIYSGHDY